MNAQKTTNPNPPHSTTPSGTTAPACCEPSGQQACCLPDQSAECCKPLDDGTCCEPSQQHAARCC